ncbi:MAG: sigma-70 family RNA polymerase sigma factor [Planctomycetales bacterium]
MYLSRRCVLEPKVLQATRLWTLAQPVVSAFLGASVRDFAARDDLLQDVAVAVIESFERYDPERPFVSWALGIAQNQLRLHWRRMERKRIVLDDELVEKLAVTFESISVEQERQFDFLQECLGKLEGRARRLCDLRYVEDLKPAAIAEVVGMSANGVAKSLQRIRERLRDCMRLSGALPGGET